MLARIAHANVPAQFATVNNTPITTDRHVVSILHHTSSLGSIKAVHAFILRRPPIATVHSLTSIINRYAIHNSLLYARNVFDLIPDNEKDVVSYTTILQAYLICSHTHSMEILQLYIKMLNSGCMPNQYTITILLQRVTLFEGKQIHGLALKIGLAQDEFIGSCLIDLYGKNLILNDAQLVFDTISLKDVVCYNALMSAYSKAGLINRLCSVFNETIESDSILNESTFVALLNGCANSGFLGASKQFHAQSIIRGFSYNETIQGVVVDMYSKCGDLKEARKAFNQIRHTKNAVAWNSIIGGYGKNGCIVEALDMFRQMQSASVRPDHITFTLLLSACSHSGFVKEGLKLFEMMKSTYNIGVDNEHICCVVDLLGRAGMIEEAYEFVNSNSHCEPGASVWSSLLASCSVWDNMDIGKVAAGKLVDIEKENSGSYVALASMYAKKARWKDANEVRELMEGYGVKKEAGCSWIENGGLVHEFRAGKRMECGAMVEVLFVCERLNLCIQDLSMDDGCVSFEDYC